MPTMEPIISGTMSMFRRWVLMPLGFSPGRASTGVQLRREGKHGRGGGRRYTHSSRDTVRGRGYRCACVGVLLSAGTNHAGTIGFVGVCMYASRATIYCCPTIVVEPCVPATPGTRTTFAKDDSLRLERGACVGPSVLLSLRIAHRVERAGG